jgi:hypothetical protein
LLTALLVLLAGAVASAPGSGAGILARGVDGSPMLLAPPPRVAPPPDVSDQGTFEIFTTGQSIGTEKFEIRVRSDQTDAQGVVHLSVDQNGKHLEVQATTKLVLDSQLDPLTYSWNLKGAQSSQGDVDFRTQPVRTQRKMGKGQEDRQDFRLDKDVVVLDDNIIHHYQLAVSRYDQAKGGTQAFRAFIPQEALPGLITLKSLGPEVITVDGVQKTARHYLLTTELAQIGLWVDDHGHLQLVSAPDVHYQAMRKK